MESLLDAPKTIRSKIMKPVIYAFSVRDQNLVTHTVKVHSDKELTVMSARLGGGGATTDFDSAFKSLCKLASPQDLKQIRKLGCALLADKAESAQKLDKQDGVGR
tara:strand:+ start:436 stop:750 length:315 start_codon:yes stop_codon:yes gene_type:complete